MVYTSAWAGCNAGYHTSFDHTNRVRNKQKWNDVYNPEKIPTLLYVRLGTSLDLKPEVDEKRRKGP